MIKFYIDLSGKKGDPLIVAGGYIAPEPLWRKFEKAWGKINRDAGVQFFHATDFYAGRDEFKGWDIKSEAHARYAKRYTRAAAEHTSYGFATGINVSSFEKVMVPVLAAVKTPHDRVTPDTYCLMNLLHQTAQTILKPGMQIAVIIEEGPGMGEAISFLYWLKEVGEGWTQPYVSFTPMDKKERPLQGADLLAHESWRRLKQVIEPDGREIRKSLQSLLRYERVAINYINEQHMRDSVPHIKNLLRMSPAYLKKSN